MSDLLIVLTARLDSNRLPGKATADVCGKPLLHWITQRLQKTGAQVVIATTDRPEDTPLKDIANKAGVEFYVHPGPPNDVVGRMAAVVKRHPESHLVMRGLGDCPFISWEMIGRAVHILKQKQADLMLWYTQPDTWPVYGSRELPMSTRGFNLINQCAYDGQREHLDMWMNHNRERFNLVYHEPPPLIYYRPTLRLEVDYPEDLAMVRAVAKDGPGMLAQLPEIIKWLDHNEIAARLNWGKVEKTGPLTSYDNGLKRRWFRAMQGQRVYRWDGGFWEPESSEDTPYFCNSGRCLLGWGNKRTGAIRLVEGHVIEGKAMLKCECGAGRFPRERF